MKFSIREKRKAAGLTQEYMAEMLDISTGLYNGLETGKRRMNETYLEGIAGILGVRVTDLIVEDRPSVAVAGKVGAGAEVDLVDAYPKGEGLYHVPCPPQLAPHGIVAVEIRGDSMEPTYRQGGVVFYSRDVLGIPTEARNQICIAEDESGKVWLKHVKPSKEVAGLFDLVSLNPKVDTMFGAKLKWAAPVRLYLPPDLVARVE